MADSRQDAQGDGLASGHVGGRWRRIRAARIFARDAVPGQARALREQEQQEHKAWIEEQRKIQHGWAKWMGWRRQSPQMADAYRRQHQDASGRDRDWLIEFAALRAIPDTAGTTKLKYRVEVFD